MMLALHIGHIDRSQQWCLGHSFASSDGPGFTRGAYRRAMRQAGEMDLNKVACHICHEERPGWEAAIYSTITGEVIRSGCWW
jgi:hypothetical protein